MLYYVAVLKKSSTSDEQSVALPPRSILAKGSGKAARKVLMSGELKDEDVDRLEVVVVPFQVAV